MPELKQGIVFRAAIDGFGGDGCGVARVDGAVVFVANALPGETVEARIAHIGHNAAWADTVRVLQASPARLEPDCPFYAQCGGCCFRHVTYAEELEAKRLRVKDALRRIGGVDLPVEVIHGAKEHLRYRNKVQFPVAPGADGPRIGFYRARSHQVVEASDCLLQPERAAACRQAVKDWMQRFHVPAYDERSHAGLVRHLYLRFNRAGETLCCLAVNGPALPYEEELIQALRSAVPALAGIVLNVNTRRTNVVLGKEYRTLWGRDWLEEELCGLKFRLSVPSFFQVNRDQTEVLYRRAAALAGLTGTETVLDLYCGTGTIALSLAGSAGRVIGAEIIPEAVKNARENARANGIANTDFFCGDAAAVAERLSGERLRPHVVVVDPPRKGLAPGLPDIIAALGPERVVYVSCDPATLARDVKRFAALGYMTAAAEAVDMFPRTDHVETVALLSRGTDPLFTPEASPG